MQLIIFGLLTGGLVFVASFVGIGLVANFNHLSVMQVASMGPSDYARPELAGVIKGLLIVQFFGIFFLPPVVFAYLADQHPMAYLGVKPPQKNSFIILGLIIMIAGYFTVTLLATVNESIVHMLPKATQKWVENGETDVNGMLDNILTMKKPADLILPVILVGALPAIGEELFFRGVLQKLFIQIFKSVWPGIIFTGFLFSAIHMQFMGFLPRMALGIILGALYWYSGSILISMLGHFVFNTINIILIYFKVADLDSNSSSSLPFSFLGLACLVAVVFLVKYLRKNSTTTYATEFPPVTDSIFPDNQDHHGY